MKKQFIHICYIVSAFLLLGATSIWAQENKDSLVNVAFGTELREDVTKAITTVNLSELSKKNYAAGIGGIESFVGGLGGNLSLWGQAPLILVDGIPRATVLAEEIETISFLKDAAAVVLYGSRAAKGVILITTKRGKSEPMKIDVRANTGFYVPKTAYPGYLDADCYMTLYNEASRNDGVAEIYDAATIYNTAAGTNPYRYPNIDFYNSDFLKKAYNKTNVTAEVHGGNERTRYYLNMGLSHEKDLLNYGEAKNNKNTIFNVRGNVDMQLTSWLKASTNAAAIFTDDYAGRGDFWGTAATLRPNRFAPLIPIDQMDPLVSSMQNYVANSNHLIDGKYLLGGISTDMTNAFADMLAAGYVKEKARLFLFDVNLIADLGNLLEGLSFKTAYSVDYDSYYSEAWTATYAVFQPTWSTVNGKDVITSLQQYNNDSRPQNESVGKSVYQQTMSFSAQFDYNRTFAQQHNVAATLLAWGYQTQNTADINHESSGYHRTSNANLGLRAAYNYEHKYYADFSGAVVHSAKLPEGNRDAFSPTVTLGWRIGREDFFKGNVSFVDDLKLTASYSKLHQDLDITDYYMYKGYFDDGGGWYQWRDGVAGGWTTGSKRGDNPELTFIQRNEFRTGLDASLFNRLVTLNTNFFVQDTKGMLTRGASTIYPSYFDLGTELSFLPYLNYNNDRRTGIDFNVNLNKKIGDWNWIVGFSGMYMTSKATRRDEVNQYEYLNREGRAIDAMWGYVSEGFFQDQSDIDNHARQTFGAVKPGDLKYKDVNEDGVVDSNDQIDLGRNGWSVAPFTYGLHLTLNWKNFTLFAMGSGQTGAIDFKSSSYYWNRGTSKFSDIVWGRWTEETKETATYPRLTTTNGDNNYRNSMFWMYKKNCFNLNKIQLTYDFSESIFDNSFIHGLSVYCSGENLLTVSKERKVMDTNIGGEPQCRFFNLGFKAAF